MYPPTPSLLCSLLLHSVTCTLPLHPCCAPYYYIVSHVPSHSIPAVLPTITYCHMYPPTPSLLCSLLLHSVTCTLPLHPCCAPYYYILSHVPSHSIPAVLPTITYCHMYPPTPSLLCSLLLHTVTCTLPLHPCCAPYYYILSHVPSHSIPAVLPTIA